MKHDWKKKEKELYLPRAIPIRVAVPEQRFFVLRGQGDPNGEEFSEAIGVLYSLSYAVKMMPKKGETPDGYFDYAVYPLEAVWDQTDTGKASDGLNKSELIYDLMIRQPEFVTEELAGHVVKTVRKKKPHPLLEKIAFLSITEGLCVQMLHVGPYDDEPASFEKMERFCAENGLERVGVTHREIYISDARKTSSEKLKAVLRYTVR